MKSTVYQQLLCDETNEFDQIDSLLLIKWILIEDIVPIKKRYF